MGKGYFPPSFIDGLVERADIVAIIGDRVKLKRSGHRYFGLCPFHQEKTGSFCVDANRQYYHCFGCHESGNVITFLERFDNLTFQEAVEKLAGMVGVSLPATSEYDQAAQRARSRLFEVSRAIAEYFKRCLPHNSAAIAYLKQRGVNQEMCERYAIGYAPQEWRFVVERIGKDWSCDELFRVGVSVNRYSLVPRFRERIMFPIKDTQGRVLGFGGRTVVDDPAKYLNSPETEIYHKSSCWYGLHEARAYHDEMMVVEGYLDVVSLAQYGVQEAVASCGTATRTAQLALLTRRVKTVVCCFDGDSAGRAAAWRALKAALPLVQDASFQFLFLPQDEDPDSLIRKWGADRFREWSAANRINLEDLLLNGLADKYDMQTIAGKQSFLQEIAEHLALMPRGIFYHLMVERISELTHLNVAELVSGKRDSVGNRREAAADSLNASSGHTADKKEFSADCHMLIAHLAKLLLCHPSLTERVLKEQELIKEFAGGKELNELAKWIGQMGADRVNLGMIVEHERDTKLAPILREASSLFMRMDKAADRQNEAARMDGGEVDFLNLVRSMRSKLNNDLIEQLIKKANQQQLSMEEKLKLQALIQENKSSLSS